MLSQPKTNPFLLLISNSSETQNILMIVIHTAVVFFAKKKTQMLEPFLAMLNDPLSLMVRVQVKELSIISFPDLCFRTCIFQQCLMIHCTVIQVNWMTVIQIITVRK